MDVLGHDDVSRDVETIPAAHLFQSLLEDATSLRAREQRCAAVTTKGDEVEVSGLLEAMESAGHFAKVLLLSAIHRDGNHMTVPTLPVLPEYPPCPQRTRTRVGHPDAWILTYPVQFTS